jgi:hypothetical protein
MSTPAHSKWSASGFEQKMLCPGSHLLQAGAPDNTSVYAAEGTAAHQVLTWALQYNTQASAFIGRYIDVAPAYTIEVTAEMAEHVQVCVDYCRDACGEWGVMLVDQRVNYARFLGVPADDAWGTADVILLLGEEIIVVDFKYGQGVAVEAANNPQMSLYALGALDGYSMAGDFLRARLVISQPRVRRAPSEWDTPVEALIEWADTHASRTVADCITAAFGGNVEEFLNPGEKQCKFCRAKATCPALREEVAFTFAERQPASPDEFRNLEPAHETDADWISAALDKVDMIEDWCKAIRAEAEKRLLAGDEVPGYKLVAGKRGARQWIDSAAVEEYLRKTLRLTIEQAYDLKLISPTSAEKLKKSGVIGDRQWTKIQELITQSTGKPHVAPVTDSRPALEITPVVEDFADLTLVA